MALFKKISELLESTELGFVIETVNGVSKKFNLGNLSKKTQYEILPSASENVGKVFQYVGETNENYTNGMFYVSLENGQGQYEWFPSSIKTVQTAVSDPTASGTSTTAITNITQDTNGVIVPTKKTIVDTKNTAGSTDSSSKLFLVGATSQADNPQTYSDDEVYTTNGVLTTKSVQVGGGKVRMEYDTTTNTLKFNFI